MRNAKFKEGLDSNMNNISKTTKESEFLGKVLEDCVAKNDPECTFNIGQKYDLTIVSILQIFMQFIFRNLYINGTK